MQISILSATSILLLTFIKEREFMGLLCSCHGLRGNLCIGETSVPLFLRVQCNVHRHPVFQSTQCSRNWNKGCEEASRFYVASFVSRDAPFRAIRQMRGNITPGCIKRRRSRVFRPRVPKVSTPILFSALIARYLRLPRLNTYLSYDVKLILRVRDNYTLRPWLLSFLFLFSFSNTLSGLD